MAESAHAPGALVFGTAAFATAFAATSHLLVSKPDPNSIVNVFKFDDTLDSFPLSFERGSTTVSPRASTDCNSAATAGVMKSNFNHRMSCVLPIL